MNLIYDADAVEPAVEVVLGPALLIYAAGTVGFLCLSGAVTVAGDELHEGAFALGSGANIELETGAAGLLITLRGLT